MLAISAHTLAREPALLAAAHHDTVHDFGGFPPALYELRYDAPGAPDLARETQALLARSGIAAPLLDRGGLDHGIWTALRYLYPAADVPVLPLALVPDQAPGGAVRARRRARAAALRRACSCSARAASRTTCASSSRSARRPVADRHGADTRASDEMPESRAFRDWMAERSAARDWDALFAYRTGAPHAVLMHPTDEHLLPWFPAAGAGGRDAAPLRLHDAVTLGALGMDCYAFGSGAPALQAALA